jgi:hypothetical protein
MDNVFDLGDPGPSGNENDTYVAKDTIFKVNNLLNSGSITKGTFVRYIIAPVFRQYTF